MTPLDTRTLRRVIACTLDQICFRSNAGDLVDYLFDEIVEKLRRHPRLAGVGRFELELFLIDIARDAEDALSAYTQIDPSLDAREIADALLDEVSA
jgi:hypothetical protein